MLDRIDDIVRERDAIEPARDSERRAMREERDADFRLGPVEKEDDIVDALAFDQHELVEPDDDFEVTDELEEF